MKKLMSIGLVLLFAFMLASCGGSSDNPQDVAKDFMTALADKNYDKAKDLGTENTVMMIGMIESMASMAPEGEEEEMPVLVWGEVKEEGDKATCFYTEEGKDAQQQLELVKVDGDWKVDMKKEM